MQKLIDGMTTELDKYLTFAAGFIVVRTDVAAFTERVLKFWCVHRSDIPTLATAGRIVFALSPNSASCERVFSLLATLFNPAQKVTLGDALQASLMLRYNGRGSNVG